MSTSIPAAHPMASHQARRTALRAVIGMTVLAGAAGGLYEGAQAVVRHYSAPTSNVSYADTDVVARTVEGAWHTPATMGDFRPAADISGGNVVSVVKAVK